MWQVNAAQITCTNDITTHHLRNLPNTYVCKLVPWNLIISGKIGMSEGTKYEGKNMVIWYGVRKQHLENTIHGIMAQQLLAIYVEHVENNWKKMLCRHEKRLALLHVDYLNRNSILGLAMMYKDICKTAGLHFNWMHGARSIHVHCGHGLVQYRIDLKKVPCCLMLTLFLLYCWRSSTEQCANFHEISWVNSARVSVFKVSYDFTSKDAARELGHHGAVLHWDSFLSLWRAIHCTVAP